MKESHSDLPELNLPGFSAKIRFNEQRKEIFDSFRNKFVVLTPEEWVRQHMLHYMHAYLSYPRGLMGVEVSLKLNNLRKRADIVVYNKTGIPSLMVECKAANIKLSQPVFDQAASYNLTMQVPFLVITNGLRILAAGINVKSGKIEILKSMPEYSSLGNFNPL